MTRLERALVGRLNTMLADEDLKSGGMGAQAELFFDGPDVEPADAERLHTLLGRVLEVMRDGRWRTLAEIKAVAGGSETSVSARLRDLRKPKWGGFRVERRRTATHGLWEYRVEVPS